jgi:hypothetical protein
MTRRSRTLFFSLLLVALSACKPEILVGVIDGSANDQSLADSGQSSSGSNQPSSGGNQPSSGGNQPSSGGNQPAGGADLAGRCLSDCDCDPVHSVGCEAGNCRAVQRLMYCCGIVNPPDWVRCPPDGGSAVTGNCVVEQSNTGFRETGMCASISVACSSWQSSACVSGRVGMGLSQSQSGCGLTDSTVCN